MKLKLILRSRSVRSVIGHSGPRHLSSKAKIITLDRTVGVPIRTMSIKGFDEHSKEQHMLTIVSHVSAIYNTDDTPKRVDIMENSGSLPKNLKY